MKSDSPKQNGLELQMTPYESQRMILALLQDEQQINKFLRGVQRHLQNMPEGSLRIYHDRHGKARYYQFEPHHEPARQYLKKAQSDLAAELAQKRYLQLVENHLKALSMAIRVFCESWNLHAPDKLFDQLSDDFQALVTPIILTDAQFIDQWLAQPYETLTNWEPDSNLVTRNGESVRSKSELMIADTLANMGIPYKYECPLHLSSKTIYPDFTLLDVHHRRELYLEHFGMMGDENYAFKALQKINDYATNKIFLGDRLLVSMECETSKLNVRLLERQLQFYMNR